MIYSTFSNVFLAESITIRFLIEHVNSINCFCLVIVPAFHIDMKASGVVKYCENL